MFRDGRARSPKGFKAVEGKDGWLFVANDSNDVFGQHAGTLEFPDSHFEQWREVLEGRVEWLAERGIPYYFVVAPDTHAIYPEKLPEWFQPIRERPIERLMRRLKESDSSVRVIYPLEELLAAKAEQQVGLPLDSHWSEFGAFVAYRRIVDELERAGVPMRTISKQDLTFTEVDIPGDLGQMLGIATSHELYVDFARGARLLNDNAVENIGALLEFECDLAPPTRFLLLGDSYSWRLGRYLAESFGRFVFAHTPILDRNLVEREQPDVVISLLSERFLRLVPDDEHGATIVEAAREKEARGRTRLSIAGDRRERLTVEAVERIRAHFLAGGRLGDATLVSLLAYTGFDRGEVKGLRWEEIGSLQVFPFLLRDLEEWRIACERPQSGVVFPQIREDFSLWVKGNYREACEAAGVPALLLKEMRKAYWHLLLRSGAPPHEVGIEAALRLQNPLLASQMRLIAELQDEVVPVEEQIRLAREKALTRA
jgi:alginate O-acetyltransferase complex protein AlgJ